MLMLLPALLVAFAPPVVAEVSLELALTKTYLENPRLRAARAGLEATDESVPEARAGERPRLDAEGSAFLQPGSGDSTRLRQSLRLRQSVFDGGATRARIEQAERQVAGERARLLETEQQVLLEAVRAFLGVLREQKALELAIDNEQRLATFLAAVKKRYRFGQVTRTDVAQAETRYAAGKAEREAAEGRLRAAGALYRRVIGDPPGTLLFPQLPGGLPSDLSAAEPAISDHPRVIELRMRRQRARAATEEALAALKPRVLFDAELSYGENAEFGGGVRGDARIGALLSVPLYQGGGAYARIRRARLRERQFDLELADIERQVREEIVAAFETLRAARARRRSLARRLEAARLALAGVREEARAGLRAVIDVLDAEQEWFRAQLADLDGRRDEILAAYRLLAATGHLTARDLGLDVAIYDENAYYREVRDAWFGTHPPEVPFAGPPTPRPRAKPGSGG